ncbi:MAG: hypothetical protein ACYC2G_02890 [Gemmatimonadaceae bacterium]
MSTHLRTTSATRRVGVVDITGKVAARLAIAAAGILALGGQAACRTSPPPVPVLAERAQLDALVGEWVGEYSSAESGRSGSIVFTLRAGADTASGDVVMTPRGSGEPLSPNVPPGASATRPAPQPLRIRFVRLENGAVSGTLEPYRDPESGALVSTVFVGALDGDEIRGTFTSSGGELPRPLHGEWHATRRAPR